MKNKTIKIFILLFIMTSLLTGCNKKDNSPKVIEKIDNTEKSLQKAEKLIENKDLLAAEKAYENLLKMFDQEPIVYKNLAYIKNYYGNKEEAAEILVKGIVNINENVDKENLYLDLIENIDSNLYQEKYKKFFLDINKKDMTDKIFNNLVVLNKENKELIDELKDFYKPKDDQFLRFMENKINNYEDEELERITIDSINKDTDILLIEQLIRDRVLIGYGYYEDLVLAKEIIEKIEENNINIDNSYLKGLKYYFENHEGEKIEKIYFEDLNFDLNKDLVLITSKEKYLYDSGGAITILLSDGEIKVIDINESKAVEIALLFSDLDKDGFKEIISKEYYGGTSKEKDFKIYSLKDKDYSLDKLLDVNTIVSLENGFILDVIDGDKSDYVRVTLSKDIIEESVRSGIYREDGKLLEEGLLSITTDMKIEYNKELKKDVINIIEDIALILKEKHNIGYISKEYEVKEDELVYNGFSFFDKNNTLIPKQDLNSRKTEEVEDIIEEESENNLTEEEQDQVIENLNKLRKYFGKTSDEIIKIMGKPDKELLEDLHLGYAKYFVYIDEDNQEKYFTFNTDSDKLISLDGDQMFIYGVDKYPNIKDITDMFGNDYIKDDEFLTGVIDLDGNPLDEIVYTLDNGYTLNFVETAYNTKEYRLSLFVSSED